MHEGHEEYRKSDRCSSDMQKLSETLKDVSHDLVGGMVISAIFIAAGLIFMGMLL